MVKKKVAELDSARWKVVVEIYAEGAFSSVIKVAMIAADSIMGVTLFRDESPAGFGAFDRGLSRSERGKQTDRQTDRQTGK